MSGFDGLNAQTMDATDDYEQLYIGRCITNKDPLGLDRIKCTIPNLYEGEEAALPWIGPIKNSPFGQGQTFGVYGSPQPNSWVVIKLQKGDPHYPVYVGSLLMGGARNSKFHNMAWGFRDPAGNELLVDMQSGATVFTHQSNIKLTFSGGSFTIDAPRNTTINAGSNLRIKASGDVDIEAGGNANVKGTTINLN